MARSLLLYCFMLALFTFAPMVLWHGSQSAQAENHDEVGEMSLDEMLEQLEELDEDAHDDLGEEERQRIQSLTMEDIETFLDDFERQQEAEEGPAAEAEVGTEFDDIIRDIGSGDEGDEESRAPEAGRPSPTDMPGLEITECVRT